MATFEIVPCPTNLKARLIAILAGKDYPSLAEQQAMVVHFMGCTACQASFQILMCAINQNGFITRILGMSEPLRTTLVQFAKAIDELELQDQLPGYLETWVSEGEVRATERYPLLALHLTSCKQCQMHFQVALHLMFPSKEEIRNLL